MSRLPLNSVCSGSHPVGAVLQAGKGIPLRTKPAGEIFRPAGENAGLRDFAHWVAAG
jgi:hypothetical protein